jgi:hypothetical protein
MPRGVPPRTFFATIALGSVIGDSQTSIEMCDWSKEQFGVMPLYPHLRREKSAIEEAWRRPGLDSEDVLVKCHVEKDGVIVTDIRRSTTGRQPTFCV